MVALGIDAGDTHAVQNNSSSKLWWGVVQDDDVDVPDSDEPGQGTGEPDPLGESGRGVDASGDEDSDVEVALPVLPSARTTSKEVG